MRVAITALIDCAGVVENVLFMGALLGGVFATQHITIFEVGFLVDLVGSGISALFLPPSINNVALPDCITPFAFRPVKHGGNEYVECHPD
jgi:hypothetical protein